VLLVGEGVIDEIAVIFVGVAFEDIVQKLIIIDFEKLLIIQNRLFALRGFGSQDISAHFVYRCYAVGPASTYVHRFQVILSALLDGGQYSAAISTLIHALFPNFRRHYRIFHEAFGAGFSDEPLLFLFPRTGEDIFLNQDQGTFIFLLVLADAGEVASPMGVVAGGSLTFFFGFALDEDGH
jgi:hypothetical protein